MGKLVDNYLQMTEKRDSPRRFWPGLVIYSIVCVAAIIYFWMKESVYFTSVFLFCLVGGIIVGIVGQHIRNYYRNK